MKPSRASPPWLGLIGSLKNRKSRNKWDVLYVNCTHYPFFCNSMSRSRTWSLKPEEPHLSETCSVWGVFGGGSISPEKVDSSLLRLKGFVCNESQLKQRSVTWLQSTRQSVWGCERQTQSHSFFSVTFTVLLFSQYGDSEDGQTVVT